MDELVTPDDSVTCNLCGKETSLAMLAHHLKAEHGIDPQEIADAPVIDDEAAAELKEAVKDLGALMNAADDQAQAMTDAELGALLLSGRWTTIEVHEAARSDSEVDFVTSDGGTQKSSLFVDRIGLLLIRLGQWVTKRGLRLSKPGRQW